MKNFANVEIEGDSMNMIPVAMVVKSYPYWVSLDHICTTVTALLEHSAYTVGKGGSHVWVMNVDSKRVMIITL